MTQAVSFDHTDPTVYERIAEVGGELRDGGPFWSDAHGGFWIVGRYEDIRTVAKDPESFCSTSGITIPRLIKDAPPIPAESDEPEHRYYRAVLAPWLTPAAVRTYEPAVRAIINEAIDRFCSRGEADFVDELAQPVPIAVMGAIFGFSPDEAERFCSGFSDVVDASARSPEEHEAAVTEFHTFLRAAFSKAGPAAGGILGAIANGTVDGRPFTERERLGLLTTTAVAATETTAHAISHTIKLLGTDTRLRESLRTDPLVVNSLVEEILRLDPPAMMLARTATRDVVVGGQEIRSGQSVLMIWGWANRDPLMFDDPQTFVPDRKPNRHMTFGVGLHRCVGMHLARLEIAVVIEEVVRRLPDLQLVDASAPRLRGGTMWGIDQVVCTFTPSAPESPGSSTTSEPIGKE